jgi:hypothetical protein
LTLRVERNGVLHSDEQPFWALVRSLQGRQLRLSILKTRD